MAGEAVPSDLIAAQTVTPCRRLTIASGKCRRASAWRRSRPEVDKEIRAIAHRYRGEAELDDYLAAWAEAHPRPDPSERRTLLDPRLLTEPSASTSSCKPSRPQPAIRATTACGIRRWP